MLKDVQEVKAVGRTRRVHVRPFAWNSRVPLALLVVLSGLFAGCGRGAATATPSQSPDQSAAWMELAPGIRYREGEGRVSLDIAPPLLSEESVRKFAEYAQGRMAQATSEEKAFWEEQLRFVKEQQALWSDEELVVTQNLHLPHTPHKPSPPPPGGPRPRAWSSRRMTCTTSSGKRTRAAPSLASRQLPFPSIPTQWASR